VRYQTSTHIGLYSIFGGFLNVFKDTKLKDFTDILSGLTFEEIFAILIPFVIGIWSIKHNEDNLDTYTTQRISKINRDNGDESSDHSKLGRQRADGTGVTILS